MTHWKDTLPESMEADPQWAAAEIRAWRKSLPWELRALARLLLDSGDITPTGARWMEKVADQWTAQEEDCPRCGRIGRDA